MTVALTDDTAAGEQVLFRFAPGFPFAEWTPSDDGVMGGRSRSELVVSNGGAACFTGTVSLENNGGFCSIRSPDLTGGLGGFEGVGVHARGDGKTYTLCLHTRGLLPGTSYRSRFTPPRGQWVRVALPFSDFVLMRYGFRAGVSPVNPAHITAISLLIGDKQEGAFALEVSDVTVTRRS
jgi:monofunctional biosynthetic peptidoglycan transglycosylase